MRIANILKPHVAQCVERWLSINDVEEFTRRIYFTVREMYTIVRNQEAPQSLARVEYAGAQVDEKAPRFD